MVARRRHPWPVARRARVVVEPVRPGANAVIGEVGVAQVAVDEVEQRSDAFDRGRDISGRRGAKVVDAVDGVCELAQCRDGLVAETGEAQRFPPGRSGPDGPQLRVGAVVHRGVDVVGVGGQVVEPRVVDANFGVRLRVTVGARLGLHGAAEAGRRGAHHDSRIAHRIGGVPRDDDFGGGILAELQMQAAHRLRSALVRLGPQAGPADRVSRAERRRRRRVPHRRSWSPRPVVRSLRRLMPDAGASSADGCGSSTMPLSYLPPGRGPVNANRRIRRPRPAGPTAAGLRSAGSRRPRTRRLRPVRRR